MISEDILDIPYIFPRRTGRGKYNYPVYYVTHFSKLKQYYLEGKIKSSFTRDDFRDLLSQDDTVKEDNARYVNSFLGFASREDIKICKFKVIRKNGNKSEKYIIQIDFKQYADLQAYIKHEGIDKYVMLKGEPDKRTLEERLNGSSEHHEPENSKDKPLREGSVVKAFAETINSIPQKA